MKAICLLSGGLDSTVSLAFALREGYEVTALTINYGQRHVRELEAAKAVAVPLRRQARDHELPAHRFQKRADRPIHPHP